jgi:hypothetical protein
VLTDRSVTKAEISWPNVPISSAKNSLVRTFIQRGSVTFEVDLDNVKAYDSGFMTDSTKGSYDVAYTCKWTPSTGSGQAGSWQCGCRDAACTQRYWMIQSFKR